MTIFNVHIDREVRLVFEGVEADSHEAAAAIACDKHSAAADDIDDCGGETFSALVEVAGNEEHEPSRSIEFEPERQRKAAPKLLDTLKVAEGFVHWALNHDGDRQGTAAALKLIRTTIAEAESSGIRSEPSGLLASLHAVLPYAENERAYLEHCWRRDRDPQYKEALEACDRALERASAAILETLAPDNKSQRQP